MRTKQQATIAERLFDGLNYIFMAVFTLVCIYPFYYLLIYSLDDPIEAARGVYLFPSKLNFQSYIEIYKLGTVPHAFLVSVEKTVLFTILCVYFSSMFAY